MLMIDGWRLVIEEGQNGCCRRLLGADLLLGGHSILEIDKGEFRKLDGNGTSGTLDVETLSNGRKRGLDVSHADRLSEDRRKTSTRHHTFCCLW